jgi:glycyl-tRNA synthetase beta chain
MSGTDFLVELGTEELPPKALRTLSGALLDALLAQLANAGIAHGAARAFATPRRLAVLISEMAMKAPDQKIQRRGPPLSAAFDASGTATRAGEAFAQSCGVALAALGRETDSKGNQCLSYSGMKRGESTRALLPSFVSTALDQLPIPKRMRWGAGEAQFVRPVHWLVMLWGKQKLAATILGTTAGSTTFGHRFHAPKGIRIAQPADYEHLLEKQGHVIASFDSRRTLVRDGVMKLAQQHGGRALVTDSLLDEVTALVEWPVPLAGRFEERFLALPRELLISVLQDHQRYFPVQDSQGRLLPLFITLSNISSKDMNVVRAGNERVVRPRLADAAFFWEQDRKTALAARMSQLDAVTFQAQLGSIGDRVRRMRSVAGQIAARIDGDETLATRTAELAKCDLVTHLVGEFPELQGTMGRYYALADGEPAEVCAAIAEHYLPRGAGDTLPATRSGLAVALADRLDALTGIFAIGQKPSGTRDPFALRRAAIGVLRMIMEKRLPLDLVALLEASLHVHSVFEAPAPPGKPWPTRAAVATDVYDYILERLRSMYLEPGDAATAVAGVTTEAFDAVLAARPRSPLDFDARLRALIGFLALPEAASLTAANKRIANLLKKSAAGSSGSGAVDATRLKFDAERVLFAAVQGAVHSVPGHIATGEYGQAFAELARLRGPVDVFFDEVMVMDPDPVLRANRLALLGTLRELFIGIADLSRLPG